MATMLAPIIGGIAASKTVTADLAAVAEHAGEEEQDQGRGDRELEDEAGGEGKRLAAHLAEVELVADRDERDRDQRCAEALEQVVEPARVFDRHQHQRQHEGLERREQQDLSEHRSRADRVAGRIERSDEDAEGREHEIGADLVDQDAEAEILRAVEGLDHRQADEGRVGEAAGQHQAAGGGGRKAEEPPGEPEEAAADRRT